MEDNKFNFTVPDSVKEMEAELLQEELEAKEANLKLIKDKNKKARSILKKLSEPIEAEIEDIVFTLSPISVSVWDMVEGKKDDPASQTIVVRECLLSPDLSDEEFNLLPAAIKYKLFMYLLQSFFSMAAKMERKSPS